jgi:hypothetical protein
VVYRYKYYYKLAAEKDRDSILPPYGNQALGINRFMLRRLMHDYLIKGHEQIMSALNASIIAQHSWVKQLNKQLG